MIFGFGCYLDTRKRREIEPERLLRSGFLTKFCRADNIFAHDLIVPRFCIPAINARCCSTTLCTSGTTRAS
jgi:hypothetical protein